MLPLGKRSFVIIAPIRDCLYASPGATAPEPAGKPGRWNTRSWSYATLSCLLRRTLNDCRAALCIFNAYVYILAFLPLVAATYFIVGARLHRKLSIAWLVVASLFFCGWWNPIYLSLIVGSTIFNFGLGAAPADRLAKSWKLPALVAGASVIFVAPWLFQVRQYFCRECQFCFGNGYTDCPHISAAGDFVFYISVDFVSLRCLSWWDKRLQFHSLHVVCDILPAIDCGAYRASCRNDATVRSG